MSTSAGPLRVEAPLGRVSRPCEIAMTPMNRLSAQRIRLGSLAAVTSPPDNGNLSAYSHRWRGREFPGSPPGDVDDARRNPH
jgi:hypothetical protein